MSRVGDDLVEAFAEMAAHVRGEIEVVSYEISPDAISIEKVKLIGQKTSRNTKSRDIAISILKAE